MVSLTPFNLIRGTFSLYGGVEGTATSSAHIPCILDNSVTTIDYSSTSVYQPRRHLRNTSPLNKEAFKNSPPPTRASKPTPPSPAPAGMPGPPPPPEPPLARLCCTTCCAKRWNASRPAISRRGHRCRALVLVKCDGTGECRSLRRRRGPLSLPLALLLYYILNCLGSPEHCTRATEASPESF